MRNHLSCNITCHDGFHVWEYYYAVKLNEVFSVKFGNLKQIDFFFEYVEKLYFIGSAREMVLIS